MKKIPGDVLFTCKLDENMYLTANFPFNNKMNNENNLRRTNVARERESERKRERFLNELTEKRL